MSIKTPKEFEEKCLPRYAKKYRERYKRMKSLEKQKCYCDRMTCFRCLTLGTVKLELSNMENP